MISEKENARLSKFLSMVLRHQPDSIGIVLDENGWTDVKDLILQAEKNGVSLSLEIIQHIVETNTKKRFALNGTTGKIRANQGHSVHIDLGYSSQTPPVVLYHGTSKGSVLQILKTGLDKRSRHHVHLSSDIETAIKVGQRHGEAFVFTVLAAEMAAEGYKFYLSDNGVWLTENVPVKFLKEH